VVIIILILTSLFLVAVIVLAVGVATQRETARANHARRVAPELMSSFNFMALAPLDPRIDARARDSYVLNLKRVLVSDYLESPDIRRVVDQALPPRFVYRRDPGTPLHE
jgi:hypothetical protein